MWMMNNFPMQTKFCEIVVGAKVVLYSGEPLSRHVEMASLNTCAHIPFYLNDPVLHFV